MLVRSYWWVQYGKERSGQMVKKCAKYEEIMSPNLKQNLKLKLKSSGSGKKIGTGMMWKAMPLNSYGCKKLNKVL